MCGLKQGLHVLINKYVECFTFCVSLLRRVWIIFELKKVVYVLVQLYCAVEGAFSSRETVLICWSRGNRYDALGKLTFLWNEMGAIIHSKTLCPFVCSNLFERWLNLILCCLFVVIEVSLRYALYPSSHTFTSAKIFTNSRYPFFTTVLLFVCSIVCDICVLITWET